MYNRNCGNLSIRESAGTPDPIITVCYIWLSGDRVGKH